MRQRLTLLAVAIAATAALTMTAADAKSTPNSRWGDNAKYNHRPTTEDRPISMYIRLPDSTMAVSVKVSSRMQIDTMIRDWPTVSRSAANATIAQYGLPDEATPSMLHWFNNGPWVMTTVYRSGNEHDFPVPHVDVLEQVVAYDFPEDRLDELGHFDGSVTSNKTAGTLAARCGEEAMNFLAINLASDIAKGTRTVDEARGFYAMAAAAYMNEQKSNPNQSGNLYGSQTAASGRSMGAPGRSPIQREYTEGLLFDTSLTSRTADSDSTYQ